MSLGPRLPLCSVRRTDESPNFNTPVQTTVFLSICTYSQSDNCVKYNVELINRRAAPHEIGRKRKKGLIPTPSQRIHLLIADEMMTYDNEFLEGLVKSGTMILISEIGDKTFFIAAIMAMRHSRLTVRPVPPIPAEFTRLPLGLSADRPRFRSPVPIDSTGLHWRHRSARRDDRTIRGDGMGRAQPGESHSTFTPPRTFIHQSNDASNPKNEFV